jgi:hypothetical protein
MIRLLVSHGASVTPEAMFATIDIRNVAGVKELLSLGATASMRRGKLLGEEFDADGRSILRIKYGETTRVMGIPLHHEVFPLYHAGMASSPAQRHPGDLDGQLESRMQIV